SRGPRTGYEPTSVPTLEGSHFFDLYLTLQGQDEIFGLVPRALPPAITLDAFSVLRQGTSQQRSNPSAVDLNRSPGDVTGALGNQEGGQRGEFAWFAQASHRNFFFPARDEF